MQEFASILEKHLGSSAIGTGTLLTDILSLGANRGNEDGPIIVHTTDKDMQQVRLIDLPTSLRHQVVLLAGLQELGRQGSINNLITVAHHRRCTIGGLKFTTQQENANNSIVFFRPSNCDSDVAVPGVLRNILEIPGKTHKHLLIVNRFDCCCGDDPFSLFPDFEAKLWSRTILPDGEVIKPEQLRCHGIWREWNDKVCVIRPLDRVSFSNLSGLIELLLTFLLFYRIYECPVWHASVVSN